MATLHNHTDADVFCPTLHVMVPANGSVDIDDNDVDKVNVASGIFRIEKTAKPVEATPDEAASRRTITRSGKPVEVDEAPVMETRG